MDEQSNRSVTFRRVGYAELNAKQREAYNFQHIANLLMKYGFVAYPIRDDWNGGDMYARHMLNGDPLTVQLKSRATFDRKYMGKNVWIGFPAGEVAYVYPHDAVLNSYMRIQVDRGAPLDGSFAWSRDGLVHWAKPPAPLMTLIEPYRLDP